MDYINQNVSVLILGTKINHIQTYLHYFLKYIH
jgi:hypothetical protein